ncbi:hypothetical protein ACHAXN_003506 [Cyclotella atomus]
MSNEQEEANFWTSYSEDDFKQVPARKNPNRSYGGRNSNWGFTNGGRSGGRGYDYLRPQNPHADYKPEPHHFSDGAFEIVSNIVSDDPKLSLSPMDFGKIVCPRENYTAVLYVAAQRGAKYYNGSRTELANRWRFESEEKLFELINDSEKMEDKVYILNSSKAGPILLNEYSQLNDFPGVIGKDVLRGIGSSKDPLQKKQYQMLGIRRFIARCFGVDGPVKEFAMSIANLDSMKLNEFFTKPDRFIHAVWMSKSCPAWNPVLIPKSDLQKKKTHGGNSTSMKENNSKPPTQGSIDNSSRKREPQTAPPSTPNHNDEDDAKALHDPNSVLKLDSNKILMFNSPQATHSYCKTLLTPYMQKHYSRSTEMLQQMDNLETNQLARLILFPGELERWAKEHGATPMSSRKQSQRQIDALRNNDTEISYVIQFSKKHAKDLKALDALVLLYSNVLHPIADNFHCQFGLEFVHLPNNRETIWDPDDFPEEGLDDAYIVNTTNEKYDDTLSFQFRIITRVDMISSKDESIFRAALENIRGISNSSDNIALEENDAMATFEIDLLCMNEINIPMTLERRLQLSTALQLRFTGSRSVTSSMQTKETGYLPGGTAMITKGPVSGRVYRRGADYLGRFTWMAFWGKDGTGIIAIDGYRVSQHRGTVTGKNTAYMREWEMLRREGDTSPDPRLSVLEAISEVLQEWGNRGYHPLVMMDANGELDEEQLKNFVQEHELYDLIAETNKGPAPRTYQGSGRRLDYMLGNKHVLSAVVRSGSMASNDGVSHSDHTLQYVNFDRKKLFGAEATVTCATYEREFKLKDTKKKLEFIAELTRIYEHQRIPERVEELADTFQLQGPTIHVVQKYQDLDNEITEAMRAAAKKAGKKDFGYHQSDALVDAGRKVRLWKSIASCVRSKRGYSDALLHLAKLLEYTLPEFSELTHRKARQEVTQAINEKREIHRTAAEHQALWLKRLAQEAAEQKPGSDWQKVLKQMIATARQKETNKRLSAIFKPEWTILDYIEVPNEIWFLSENGEELYKFDDGIFVAHQPIDERVFKPIGVCKVLPPNTKVVQVEVTRDAIYVAETTGESVKPSWRIVDDPAEMQEWLRRRNKRHLNQMHVEQRPPTRAEFQSVLAEHGTSEVAQAILDGTFDPTTLKMDEGIETFIQGLQRREKEKSLTMPKQMTTKEFQESMKVTHEDTSSSASGLHYTLWKAIAKDDDLSATHAIMISLPFMYGFVCERWRKIIDCMLEKKAGVRQIHIMRIICLFEADFNTLLKFYFNKHIMPNAEKSGLSPDQWGGRNNRSAPACALRKLIAWEYARFTKTVLTLFLVDLQSNFDCIMPDMSSIFLMKKGMPPEAAYSRAATMASLERSVRTATGTSTETYQHDPGQPSLPGEGQGKADSMAIWTLISIKILLMHGKCATD